MFYVNQKVVSIADGVEGYKRVTLEFPPENTGGEVSIETIDVPSWEAEILITEEAVDPSEARNIRGIYVVDKIYAVLQELDINVEELGYYLQKLLTKTEGTEEAAINRLFGKESKYDIRISDWENTKK